MMVFGTREEEIRWNIPVLEGKIRFITKELTKAKQRNVGNEFPSIDLQSVLDTQTSQLEGLKNELGDISQSETTSLVSD